jgi:hypothetical protein
MKLPLSHQLKISVFLSIYLKIGMGFNTFVMVRNKGNIHGSFSSPLIKSRTSKFEENFTRSHYFLRKKIWKYIYDDKYSLTKKKEGIMWDHDFLKRKEFDATIQESGRRCQSYLQEAKGGFNRQHVPLVIQRKSRSV